jgi:hypothetical protein
VKGDCSESILTRRGNAGKAAAFRGILQLLEVPAYEYHLIVGSKERRREWDWRFRGRYLHPPELDPKELGKVRVFCQCNPRAAWLQNLSSDRRHITFMMHKYKHTVDFG